MPPNSTASADQLSVLQRASLLFGNADKAWLAIGLIVLTIGFAIPSFLAQSLMFTGQSLWSIAPFLLFSAILAGYLEAASADQLIGKVLSNRVILAIIFSAVFGALSPFCSCGVIPLIAALLVAGVPLPAVMAFWVTSPIMSPSMFVVTSAGLGSEFALVKTASAIMVGLIAGATTMALQQMGMFRAPLKVGPGSICGAKSAMDKLKTPTTVWNIWAERERVRTLWEKTWSMCLFLGKWLTLAFLLESLMIRYLPPELLAQWLGPDSQWAIPLAAFIGVPAYMNGFAAVPVVSGLIDTGMSKPAGLTFMLAGAMTSIPAAIAVFSLVKRSLFAWYIVLAIVGAMLAGIAYELGLAFGI